MVQRELIQHKVGTIIYDNIRPSSLIFPSMILGGVACVSEFVLGAVSKAVWKRDWFKYKLTAKGDYTSLLSFPIYSTLIGTSITLTSKYLRWKGYKTLKDVPLYEWSFLGMWCAGTVGAIEWLGGYIFENVIGKKFFSYPDNKLKYTSVPSILLWGIGGVMFTIAGLYLTSALENKTNGILIGTINPNGNKMWS